MAFTDPDYARYLRQQEQVELLKQYQNSLARPAPPPPVSTTSSKVLLLLKD